MGAYDWILVIGVLYTGIGSDLLLNWGAGLITGKRLAPDDLEFFYPYPFPGTPLHAECVELGLLAPGETPRQSYSRPAFATLHLSIEELQSYRNRGLRSFYLRPSTVLRTLVSARSATELRNYVRVGLSQLRQLAGQTT